MNTSLQKLQREIQIIRDALYQDNNLAIDVKNSILGLLDSFLQNAIDVDKILYNYQQSIHLSIEKRKESPFSWNSIEYDDYPVQQENNFDKDIEFYHELITYCVRLGNTDLLDYWGIQYLSQPDIRLAKPISDYLEEFSDWINAPDSIEDGIDPITVQPYIQHLIDSLSTFI
ncbi:hypothetical protein H6F96_05465 [Microcoleus sp. FACHB-53]|nr:hypothetical protein [Microcoleus sp. FACHB-53]